MATSKAKPADTKRKSLEERAFTSKRVRPEDEAEGIRNIKIPGKKADTKKAK